MSQQIINVSSIISYPSASRGLDECCPSPLNSLVVTVAMSEWGRYQWQHRDVEKTHGYPAINPLSVEWGLGRGDQYDYESPMSATAEIAHQQIIALSGPAPVFAWLYWAHPKGGSVRSVQRMAQHLLPYTVPRGYADMWLAAVAGAVMGVLNEQFECADSSVFFYK